MLLQFANSMLEPHSFLMTESMTFKLSSNLKKYI